MFLHVFVSIIGACLCVGLVTLFRSAFESLFDNWED